MCGGTRGGICPHLHVWLSAASAQRRVPVLPAGRVNVTVSSVAEESHGLCGNRIAVTPVQGGRDTVIKSLLVKVGHISGWRTSGGRGLSLGAVTKMPRGSLTPSWTSDKLAKAGRLPFLSSLSELLFLHLQPGGVLQEKTQNAFLCPAGREQ